MSLQKRTLGRGNVDVTVLGLGGVFVSNIGTDFDAGVATVQRALEMGINFIDTAPSYGDSELVIAEALQRSSPTSDVVITTKLGGVPEPFDPKSPQMLYESAKRSLELVGDGTTVGLLVHEPDRPLLFDWWDDDDRAIGPVNEVLKNLLNQNLIAFNGLAGTTAYELANRVKTGKFDTVLTAFNYSLLWREAETSVIPAAIAERMGIIVGAPLQQGALSVRYDEEVATATWLSPPRRAQFQELYRLLDDLKVPIHELSIRWALSNKNVSSVVVGARNLSELESNIEAASKGPLSHDVLKEIDRIAALVPFRPFEEPGGAFGLPFARDYRGPGPLGGTASTGGIKKGENA